MKNVCVMKCLSVVVFMMMVCIDTCTHCMEQDIKNDNTFALVIHPESKYTIPVGRRGFKVKGNIAAFLHGDFSDKNNIDLFHVKGTCKISKNGDENYQEYTPISLSQKLASEEEKRFRYPITWHKKMAILPHDKLELIIEQQKKLIRVPVPEHCKRRMARYLLKDLSDMKADCFHLCNNVALHRLHSGEQVSDAPLIHYMDFIENEKDLVPGDVIAFFIHGASNEKQRSIYLKHYAIVLAAGAYLSKWNKGQELSVCDIEALKKSVICDGYVRINHHIGKREDFLKDPFSVVIYRPIIMNIYPYIRTNCGMLTLLSGFYQSGKQYDLRSDISGEYYMKYLDDTEYGVVRQALSNGSTGTYSMAAHKKLNYLIGDEVLVIMIRDQDDLKDNKMIHVSNTIKKNFLSYLKNNSERTGNCFDFCEKLCLKTFDNCFDEIISCDHLKDVVSERDLRPGDAVMLSSPDKLYGEHYAIFLHKNIYLSKLGNEGHIVVSDLAFLHRQYKTSIITRIRPEITQYESFWQNRLPVHRFGRH